MRILALDTATPSCSVAVTDGESLLAELTVTSRKSHSRHVMILVRHAVEWSGIPLSDIDGFAVSIGPGTFTGLRIGIGSLKGMAAALKKPVVGVSSLKALAFQAAPATRLVCSLLDARKGEVYFGCYRHSADGLSAGSREGVSAPEDVCRMVDGPCTFAGPGALLYRDLIVQTLGKKALFAPAGHHTIRASSLARLAERRFACGATDDVSELVPVYIRKSDAELGFAGSREKAP